MVTIGLDQVSFQGNMAPTLYLTPGVISPASEMPPHGGFLPARMGSTPAHEHCIIRTNHTYVT